MNVRPQGVLAAYANARNADAGKMLADLNDAMSDFRGRVETRIEHLERGLDDMASAAAGRSIGGWSDDGNPSEGHVALGAFIQTGALPQAAMSTDSDPDGGYTVSRKLSDQIQSKVRERSPIGRLAREVIMTTGDVFEEPWDVGDIGAAWVGENEARPEQTQTNLRLLSVPCQEIYTLQPVTQRLLDDSEFDIGGWMDEKITDKFGRAEGAAFVTGDGVRKPRGLVTYDTSTEVDGVRAWSVMQYIPTGHASAFASSNPADALFNLVYALRAPYRKNARWLMNLATAGVVRKLKDSEGRYLWADAREGQPATLCGFPVEIDEEMQDLGANAFPIAFGDFRQAYVVVRKPGIRFLRDPFTAKPKVLFYAYRRVGGGVQNWEAVKLLKCAES